MKSLSLSLVLACLCAIPVAGSAATVSASFQASLTIVESCAIDSSAKGPGATPAISCSHASAYRIDAAPAAAPMQQSSNGNIVTVTF